MDSTKISLIGIACVFICILLGEMKSSLSSAVKISSSLLIFIFALGAFSPLVEFFAESAKESSLSSYIPLIMKALGISFCSLISSDICRDAGYSALASGIELVSKAQILLLALPLIKDIIAIAEEVIA